MSTSPDLSGTPQDGRANLDDWRGVGDMVAILTTQVSAPIEGMHRAITDRWFRLAGPAVEPARRVVDGLIALTYQTVRLSGSAVGATISIGSDVASRRVSLRPVWETRRGRYVQSVLNGVWGDRLEAEKSSMRIQLGLRDPDGSTISPSPTSLCRAIPNPSTRVVVLLHGFGETERCWGSGQSSLAEGLEADGFSVLRPRYNTGRPVTDSGSELADLLEAVTRSWPVPVEEIALIGHSMGGLVAQNALVAARSAGHRWARLATHLVAIGTPHLGSPVEKGVAMTSRALGLFKETRPLATFLEGRSAGIKNLGYGADHRPDRVRHHAVAGVVTTDPGHPLGVLVGDLVVRVSSALGQSRGDRAGSSDVLVVGGRHHADLLDDPEVVAHTRRWLAPTPRQRRTPSTEHSPPSPDPWSTIDPTGSPL
ncbi:MAG TPA: alpha/beta fold hydrolase [Acidimicrobiia bacterium]|nr:alpha/beta fold hydrolase [Acidimicrobiia bacterium]